ncbi:uncharacterized protein Z520_00809 [Fonsecaea multimorphosa CBS 102226]|uniref:ER transporter 6TM N-terminal domain-containing protein n=1 Tax=Fonsecaea multimorphosa CBS 102226 TaxID=1442371 RepID=A0A0D2J3X9_9EURO|nr:uncharacterized protein Z520_00809 [Fonsecaea multimorphosa CBS 102226]KIY04117.1 hypothetical protein Z520_00809 [Fonsecaea multimorphosa CBS 102226]OAL31948.1 hypothetical protein AYO22_00818 [Fonsecaea multimorphosa]
MSEVDNKPSSPMGQEEDNKAATGKTRDAGPDVQEAAPPKPGLLKKIQTKLNLDVPTLLLMLKGGLPPAIALAAYQSDKWAKTYSTLGYLIAITSFLSLPILPRAKFVQSMIISIITVCFAAAVSLLTIQCAVSARQQTVQRPNSTTTGSSGSKQSLEYSAAANVTAAVWLFFWLWVANTVRAARPQLLIVSIQFTIFVVVASTYTPTFPNMTAGMGFVDRLLKVFLTGYALATAVSLFIIPFSSRLIAKKQMAGLLNLMKAALSVHTAYLHGITNSQVGTPGLLDENGKPLPLHENPEARVSVKAAEEAAQKLKVTIQKATQLFGQLKLEIGFAKKEIGWGKLQPEDFGHIWGQLQNILLPVAGLSTFVDILQSVKRHKAAGENLISDLDALEAIKRLEAEEWQEVVVMSRIPFWKVKTSLMDGLTHVAYVLELTPRPKTPKKDIETAAETSPAPGDPAFAQYLKGQISDFQEHRQETMRKWCEKKGIEVPSKFWEDASSQYNFEHASSVEEAVRQKQNHQQLYLILYLEYLLFAVCHAVMDFVLFADSKVQDGTMRKNKLIFPGWRRIRKLLQNAFMQMDASEGLQDGPASGIYIWVGDSLQKHKDPEHLPPTTLYQRVTNHLRSVPKFLASDASHFGFRAAVASISLAIIGYLRQTHAFYLAQRGIWAVIMVAISMGAHAGAGVQGFILRIVGTAISMVVSITVWYMGDQKPAAIIPLIYLVFVCGIYVILKHPKQLITAVISIVTTILIIGYELQDKKVGTKVLSSNGQEFYHVYLLAPYRLVSVVAGLGVAFFWTYFPYPITTHATLRKDLGTTLYLMANYYSCMHSTVEMHLRTSPDLAMDKKNNPMRKLSKARRKVFDKLIVMLNRLREHSQFLKYEPTFGGKFPKETYDELIVHMQSLFNYMALTAYSSNAFSSESEESEWLKLFKRVTANSTITSHALTSTLCLVSASITNSQPLPPYISVARPIDIAGQLAAIDPGILSIKHIKEPCYAAFAVLEIASILIMQETCAVLAKVRELVGEVDFSVHFGQPGSIAQSDSTLDEKRDDFANGDDSGRKGKVD